MSHFYRKKRSFFPNPDDFIYSIIDTQPKSSANYANISFEQSLEYYENSKDLIAKSKPPEDADPLKSETPTPVDEVQICCECRHSKAPERTRTLLGPKSSSNPSLCRPLEKMRRRADSDYRIRKRSYSSESLEFLDNKCPSETGNLKQVANEKVEPAEVDEFRNFSQTVDGLKIRRSSSVPSKASSHNRDSSGSNDSGVSEGSLSNRATEQELAKKTLSAFRKDSITCFHSSLPRKSRSVRDPFQELSFRFLTMTAPVKSNSAEGDIPKGGKSFGSPGENSGAPYTDTRSTSSGTSDMSDYIETLSLSSHSSSDAPDALRLAKMII